MPFVPGPWPPTLAVVVATVALAGCTRFGFRHPVESDDTAADAQRPDSHDVPADTASGVDAPDAITCDGAAVEGVIELELEGLAERSDVLLFDLA